MAGSAELLPGSRTRLMTDHQWNDLLAAIEGKPLPRPPIGFIIDSPWLPNWFGADILDYFTSEDLWFEANRKAIETFPEIIFLPGFWSEFGMCTEPSAFGAKCVFPRNEFPFADKVIHEVADSIAVVHFNGRQILKGSPDANNGDSPVSPDKALQVKNIIIEFDQT